LLGLLTGLSGSTTIGGTTPNFPDVITAIKALKFAGVCGPTTFNIRTGTYTDQFELGQVVGMDATNTVTFRSEAGHRDSVVFDYSSTALANNYIVKMDNADYFHFESMTLRNSGASYGVVMLVNGGSDHNVVYDCKLHTPAASTSTNVCVIYSASGNDEYNRFENCSIIGGSYGAYWYGTSTASLEKGTEFINNEFQDNYYYGLRLYYEEAPVVSHNRVFGVSSYTSRYGIYGGYCDKAAVFTYNSIESNATSFFLYGLSVYYSDANANARGLVANNAISVGTTTSTSLTYGLYVYYTGYFNVYNNSVNCLGNSTTSRALYLYYGGANNVKNNTFTNFANGYAVYTVSPFAINEMDYNNLYTTGATLAYYDIANTATFADWQNASGQDMNSLNVDPGYYSDFDLHVCSDSLNNAGTPLALVTDDFDGQPRNSTTPDIGADEFSPLGNPGFIGEDVLVCTGETVTLYAGAPSDVVQWSNGATTNMLVVSNPGTYTVSVIGACGIAFDTVVVTNSALVYTGYLNASVTEFCTGGSALLTSTMPATTYSWTGGSSNDSLVVTSSGTYTLNISDACGSGSESVVITENTIPVAGFTSVPSFLTSTFTNTSTGGGNPTYLWNFGDGTTSTMMDPAHVYNTVGTFTVTLTVTNACGSNTFTGTVVSSTIGLEEVNGVGTISVYPNPSNGLFQIDFNMNNDMNITVQVTNVLGESVYMKDLGSISATHKDAIDITNAAPGVYYVTIVSNNEKVMTSKLVKQ
ncbi:MAG: PKD domain-containing protein, partial [Bacteroidota bacterium]